MLAGQTSGPGQGAEARQAGLSIVARLRLITINVLVYIAWKLWDLAERLRAAP